MQKLTNCKAINYIILLLFAGPILFAGCASIIKGSGPESVSLKSKPSAANIEITDLRTGTVIANGVTPYTVALKKSAGYFKKAQYKVTINKEGYKPQEFSVEGTASGWYILGNLVFGGLIGWLIVDPATGAMWSLQPKDIDADMGEKIGLFKQNEGLMVLLRSDLPELPSTLLEKLKPLTAQ